MRTQPRRIRLRTSRQNNIANKLRAPRTIRPRNNHSLRHARVPNQRCLDLPRLNAEAAYLNLMVRTPQKLQNPSPRNVKLPNNTNRNWLQTTIQNMNPVVAQRTPDRDAHTALLAFNSKSN